MEVGLLFRFEEADDVSDGASNGLLLEGFQMLTGGTQLKAAIQVVI